MRSQQIAIFPSTTVARFPRHPELVRESARPARSLSTQVAAAVLDAQALGLAVRAGSRVDVRSGAGAPERVAGMLGVIERRVGLAHGLRRCVRGRGSLQIRLPARGRTSCSPLHHAARRREERARKRPPREQGSSSSRFPGAYALSVEASIGDRAPARRAALHGATAPAAVPSVSLRHLGAQMVGVEEARAADRTLGTFAYGEVVDHDQLVSRRRVGRPPSARRWTQLRRLPRSSPSSLPLGPCCTLRIQQPADVTEALALRRPALRHPLATAGEPDLRSGPDLARFRPRPSGVRSEVERAVASRVLVTGASGFIGMHCLRPLLDAGYEVVATHRSARPAADPGRRLGRVRPAASGRGRGAARPRAAAARCCTWPGTSSRAR